MGWEQWFYMSVGVVGGENDSCTYKLKILKSDGSLTETGKHYVSCIEKSVINRTPLVELTNVYSPPF